MNDNNSVERTIDNQITIGEEKSEAIARKDSSLKRLDVSFNKHIELKEYKKSNLLAYWISDFSNYHDNERLFKPSSLKVFKRGDIVKANLGFNVGNELGGLHYCIVINKNDNLQSGTLNVIPLSSAKENKKYNNSTCIDLGDELYSSLEKRLNLEFSIIRKQISEFDVYSSNSYDTLKNMSQKLDVLEKTQIELNKMKHGSFALLHQITTISKQRIYKNPLLSKIRLSPQSLDLIDSKIKELYTK